MKKNQEITSLAYEIMLDITDNRLPLHNVMLKGARLSLLVDIPGNVELFNNWAKWAEQNQFVTDSFQSSVEAAKDRDFALSSSNPRQYVLPIGNAIERSGLREEAKKVVSFNAHYRTETYKFALGIYHKWQFGNVAETIFEQKRKRVEPILEAIFPDVHQRLNSIEQNLRSSNDEDWKNAITSCRTLLSDLADVLNPPSSTTDSSKYINRLKDYVSPMSGSQTERGLYHAVFEELKNRIELASDFTQGGAHQERSTRTNAENVVLHTYLVISELAEIYGERNPLDASRSISPSPSPEPPLVSQVTTQ